MSVEASGVFFMRLTPGGAGVIRPRYTASPVPGCRLPTPRPSSSSASRFYEAGEGIFAAIMLLFCGDYFLKTFADVTILGLNVTFIGIFMFAYKFVQVGGVLLLCILPARSRSSGASVSESDARSIS